MITIVYGVKNVLTGRRKQPALDSFNQTDRLKNCEVIVCDYGSTDNIKEVAKDYGFKYFYVKPDPNVGFNQCKILNKGVYEAENPYILTIGADFILSDSVPEVIENIISNKECVCLIPVFHWKHDEKELKLFRGDWRWCHAYPKEQAIIAGGYDERFVEWGHEDIDFVNRMKEKCGLEALIVNDALILHQWHGKKYADKHELQEGGNPNVKWFYENRKTGSKNMVNSYW
jgi:glycosyltransferase involved in cell wall biosynthesis